MAVGITDVLLYIAGALVTHLLISTFLLSKKRRAKNSPPSPPGLPFLGNISIFLFSSGKSPWLVFKDLAARFGDIFKLNVAGKQFLVLSSPEAIREAFVRKSGQFAGRPFMYSISLISQGNCGIAFGDSSPAWKFHRKNTASALRQHLKSGALFEDGSLTRAETAIQREIEDWLGTIARKPEQEVLVEEDLTTSLINVICNMTFSKRYDQTDPELTAFVDANSRLKELLSPGHPLDLFPVLRVLPLKRLRTIQEIISIQDQIVRREYREHLDTFDPDNIRDLTDAFLQVMKEVNDGHSGDEFMMTENHVIMWMFEVFSGGFESSLQTMRWVVAYLLHNPEVQRQAQSVLDNNVYNRLPCWGDRQRLAYIEAIVLETLRHSSLSSLNAPHKTTCDTSVGGFDVAKDTTVITNLWWVHHDPNLWDQPSQFKPERFINSDGQCATPKYFMPFSIGGRECLGKKLAMMQLFLFVAGLLQNFSIRAPRDNELPELEPTLTLPIRTVPNYRVMLEKRECSQF
ncbi:steroid 17-alpha-hydroxylase/17,20 lyase-like [Amphiura filiformis]|uniref:steroid 17-alpha-hydroxylase/17,20 lyase-like n=1 Tax=Amphiura filiformis TaxID=82378 RepID=UPI003B228B1E